MKPKYKITITDKILAATFLKILPKRITPNQLTLFRFFLIPFVMILLLREHFEIGLLLFAIAAFSDALDGALARTTDRVTVWGMTYDPLADKLLIGITAIIILPKYVSLWIIFAIIFIEMLIIGFGYYYKTNYKTEMVQANVWGKTKMVSQSIGVILVLIYMIFLIPLILTIAEIIFVLAIFLAIISLVTYSL